MECGNCHEDVPDEEIKRRKLPTAYVDEEKNWITSCQDCFDEMANFYYELWNDFYSGR